jgi:uncharacterized protein YceH (UPF0502 family)
MGRVLGLPSQSVALLATLDLRGPQTASELRANSDALHRFADMSAVEGFLDELRRGRRQGRSALHQAAAGTGRAGAALGAFAERARGCWRRHDHRSRRRRSVDEAKCRA